MHCVIRSTKAGDKKVKSMMEKSFSRMACQAAIVSSLFSLLLRHDDQEDHYSQPPSGTQILVAASRTTRPKL
jgi:hypothetical protein